MNNFNPEVYINPYTDFGFKKLFGTEYNKDLLTAFLNALIEPDSPIEDITYLNPEQLGRTQQDRRAVFDIYCMSKDGTRFIVEMQRSLQMYFKDRSVFYAAFPITHQAQAGELWHFKLDAVYVIGILNFCFDDSHPDNPKSTVKLTVQETQKIFFDKLTMIYLEMPKFKKKLSELETDSDRWLYILQNLAKLSERPQVFSAKIFEKLFEAARIAAFTPAEAMNYHESLKTLWDNYAVITTAKEEGKSEKALQIALNLKNLGIDIRTIAQATNLAEAVIQKL